PRRRARRRRRRRRGDRGHPRAQERPRGRRHARPGGPPRDGANPVTQRDGLPMVLAKAALASGGVVLFLLPLATPPGIVAGVVGTFAGYLLARAAAARGLRLPAGILIAALIIGAGDLAGRVILDRGTASTQGTIWLADVAFFGLVATGAFLAIRLLSQTWRIFSILELAVVVGPVAHTFADHRHHHIDQPRFFSDWAWSQGIDPATVLAAAGVAAIVLAAFMMLSTRRASKLLATLLWL